MIISNIKYFKLIFDCNIIYLKNVFEILVVVNTLLSKHRINSAQMANFNLKVFTRWLNQMPVVTRNHHFVTFIGRFRQPYKAMTYNLRSRSQPYCSSTILDQCPRQYYTGKPTDRPPPRVVHDRGGERFYMDFKDYGKAYINYEMDGHTIRLINTYVPEEMRGHQIAEKLAEVSSDNL